MRASGQVFFTAGLTVLHPRAASRGTPLAPAPSMTGDVGGNATRPTGSGNGTDADHHGLDRSRVAPLFACARALTSTAVQRLPAR